MKAFRFPRSSILLMVTTFLTILFAIDLAREMATTVQDQYAANLTVDWWSLLPATVLRLFVVFWGIGALGYAVVFALRRSGVHRFSRIETWPEPRK